MADRPLSERLADAMAAGVGNSKLFNLIDEARELARRVERAPVVEVKAAGTDVADGACRVYAITTPEELAAAPPIVFRRVALVEVPHG